MTSPECELSERDGVVVARLHGDIDVANVPTIAARISEAVHNDALGLVVDLSTVRYLDSAGIHMLFQFAQQLATCRQGMALAVAEDSPIRTLLKITNFQEAAAIHSSATQAEEALRSGTGGYY